MGQKGQKALIGTENPASVPSVPFVPFVLTSKGLTPDQIDALEERAAIIEFDSRPKSEPPVPRPEAERRAAAEIINLTPTTKNIILVQDMSDPEASLLDLEFGPLDQGRGVLAIGAGQRDHDGLRSAMLSPVKQ
jgi:hypothetical protein